MSTATLQALFRKFNAGVQRARRDYNTRCPSCGERVHPGELEAHLFIDHAGDPT